ncbi:MAG TPA: hypothetical protein VL527_16040 [Dongiaceae bacterium]|jgi:hypothetical protein|nr:hypothetical protein [Dongiaceae bacterium]
MKTSLAVLTLLVCAWVARAGDLPPLREQISFPPQVLAFLATQEQEVHAIAAQYQFTLAPAVTNYFATARAGRARAAQQIYSGLFQDTNAPGYLTPVKQPVLEAELAVEAFASGDPGLVQTLSDDLMQSLPAGCLYFGGTDPGRGLPTLACRAPGDPVFVLSQNKFLDGRYMQYARDRYGAKINLPATNEVQAIIQQAYAGKTGFAAWVAASSQILQSIIAQNPGRTVCYEASFPAESLYPRLAPHGLVMTIAPQPLERISPQDIATDRDFWTRKITALKALPAFAGDASTRRTYAHERAASAGIYAWRAQTAPDPAERDRMFAAATNAFGQVYALDAGQTEAVYAEVNLLMNFHQPATALTVVKDAAQADPANASFKTMRQQLEQMPAPPAPAKP